MDLLNYISSAGSMDVLVKLSLALALGAVLGLERIFAHRPAGMRTYALVSMGAALFVIISELVSKKYALTGLELDPLRMASNIIIGIGFLGAGVIIFKDSTLVGLTTAAGLWVSAGIGMAVGFGYFNIAIISATLTLFIFTILSYIEHALLSFHDGNGLSEG